MENHICLPCMSEVGGCSDSITRLGKQVRWSIAAVANTRPKLECSEGQIPLEKCYTTQGGWEGTGEGFHSLALLTSEATQIPQGYLSVAR